MKLYIIWSHLLEEGVMKLQEVQSSNRPLNYLQLQCIFKEGMIIYFNSSFYRMTYSKNKNQYTFLIDVKHDMIKDFVNALLEQQCAILQSHIIKVLDRRWSNLPSGLSTRHRTLSIRW